jgi:hypothetical protein
MNTIIQPYAKTSISSKVLARALGCKRIAIRRSTYNHPVSRSKVINWGSQRLYPGIPEGDYINNPTKVANASNKIKTFQCLSGAEVPTLAWFTDKEHAQLALDDMEVNSIYVRHKLSSNSGKGIEVFNHGDTLPDAPLYTGGLHKWTEWRLHIGLLPDGTAQAIRVQQKVRRDLTKANSGDDLIRNHGADYVFRIKDLDVPNVSKMKEIGKQALKALGLDFGAIDMAHTPQGWKVLEVNTACGLAGSTTVNDYVSYFKRVLS